MNVHRLRAQSAAVFLAAEEGPAKELSASLAWAAGRIEALENSIAAAMQRLNESGTGEMGLLDTIHATHEILRAAR